MKIDNIDNIDFNDWDEEEVDPYHIVPGDFKGHEDFYNFLVENNAYESYIYNFKLHRGDNIKQFFEKYKVKQKNYIRSAFIWLITESINWSKLSTKWTELTYNNI